MHVRDVTVTLNGDLADAALGAISAPFTYYEPAAFGVARLSPRGGPASGGTLVTVYLAEDDFLVDLGGNESGVRCRFGGASDGHAAVRRARDVAGKIVDCRGRRRCGGGRRAIQCRAPRFANVLNATASTMDVPLTVSINGGQHFADGAQPYTYYRDESWLVDAVQPMFGPVSGNTSVLVTGLPDVELAALGDVRCRFGELQPEVDGSLLAAPDDAPPSRIQCRTPAYWHPAAVTSEARVDIEVTLNGQDWLKNLPQQVQFAYRADGYDGRACAWGLDTCEEQQSSEKASWCSEAYCDASAYEGDPSGCRSLCGGMRPVEG